MDTYAITRWVLKWIAGSALPARWFYTPVPPVAMRRQQSGRLHIEIVSHCWQYSRLQAYQLSSLIQNPVSEADITMTVFYSVEDTASVTLLDFFQRKSVKNVTWNFRAIEKENLFRRSIGRNMAAHDTTADWIWFTDCDMTFQKDCLNSLNRALQGRTDALLYPEVESKTAIYTDNDLINSNSLEEPQLMLVDSSQFFPHQITRATGPLQITHGEVARAIGYCDDVECYQQPAQSFQKATEDRVFRWLLATQGEPIQVDGVCRIQHVEKGRYKPASSVSFIRRLVRRAQHLFFR